MIAEIIIDIKNRQVNRTFDYLVPSHLESIVKVGFRVMVPFGKAKRVGYIVKLKATTEYSSNIKEILDTVDVKPILDEECIEIAKFISEEYFSYYATSLDTMIPSALKAKYQKTARLNPGVTPGDDLKQIFRRKEIIVDNLDNAKQKLIYEAASNNLVTLDTRLKKLLDDRISMIHLNNPLYESRSAKVTNLIAYLTEIDSDIEESILKEDLNIPKKMLDDLVDLNVLTRYMTEEHKEEAAEYSLNNIDLNEDQTKVYNSVKYDEYKTYLLHGITGSGKTEIYIKWISDLLENGKASLLLVPEISLTPQITGVLKARFNAKIEVLHSRLTQKEKYLAWKRILNGDVKIVVGARSAIFAPLKNLGIIIIDEAHDQSYTQFNNPKYDAKDIAILRAKRYNIPLVLGTATPKVTDYYLATNGEYELLELKKRANNRPLPKCDVVDMVNELKMGNRTPISYKLEKEINTALSNNEQVILFLNRRGYSTFVMCRGCGETLKCPHCDVSLTYHKNNNYLKCHYCGYMMPNVSSCPSCASDKIRFVGNGTEKIFEYVQKKYPNNKVLRVDTDTIKQISDYDDYYEKFKNHEADIIVGTQMITKGLDFKDVTLVGVLNADLAMKFPSTDANEVAFDLIEQVAGRAGRSDKDGKVVIQTYDPKNYVIKSAQVHDYDEFYKNEITKRQLQMLPPFSELFRVLVKSKDLLKCQIEAEMIANAFKARAKDSIILGPCEDTIFKRDDVYTYLIQIQAIEDAVLEVIRELYPKYQRDRDIILDIERVKY